MNVNIRPVKYFKGSLQLPASKSYSIRAFMIASCGGNSTIIRPSDCDDAKVAIRAAKMLGAKVMSKTNDEWTVQSCLRRGSRCRFNVGESGTVLRFILPLMVLQKKRIVVAGEGTLKGRPNHFLNQTLRRMGGVIQGKGSKESVPIHVGGGTLHGGKVVIDGSISSQFISALLITCPQLEENTHLVLKGDIVSQDYIMMTRQVLAKSGIKINTRGLREIVIKGNQPFRGLKRFTVPSDYGLAAFHLAAGALIKSDITLLGSFNDQLLQADGHILPLLRKMGVKIRKSSRSLKMKGPFSLKGGEYSLKSCPDLLPIMSILALFAKDKTRLCDIGHARLKESDRISDLRKELLKLGANVTEGKNSMTINPVESYRTNCRLDPHGDHRLAMAFSVLGLKIGVRVKDSECVSKSYPGFYRDFKKLGVHCMKY